MIWPDVDALLAAAPGTFSACVWDANLQPRYGYNADFVHPAASLIKVAIALAVSQAAQRGALDLAATITLDAAQRVEGDGSVDQAPAGSVWRLDQLLHHMLNQSDNTASNLLIGILEQAGLGMAAVTAAAHAVGATNTRLQRRFMDYAAARAGRENLTTAADLCALLGVLVSGQPGTAPLVAALHGAVVSEKLVAGVPSGVAVAHKTGDIPGVEHDAGIVYAPGGLFIVALLASEQPDAEAAQRTIAAAARLIYHHMEYLNAA